VARFALPIMLLRGAVPVAACAALAWSVASPADDTISQQAPAATEDSVKSKPPDTTTTSTATATAPTTSESAGRADTYRVFRQQFDARHFAEALVPAQALVDQTQQEFGATAEQLINPLINLATTQLRLKDYSSAEVSFKRAVKIVETHQGGYSREVVKPLFGLGMTYSAAGDYTSATDTLRRAVDVSRKVDGLFNPAQLEMLDSLIAGYVALNEYDDAQREQQYALRLAEATYGKNDPRLVPSLQRTAGWFEAQGRFFSARQMYSRCLDIVRQDGGNYDLRTVVPLRGIARTYRLEYFVGPETPEGGGEESAIGGVGPGPTALPSSANGVSVGSMLNPDGEDALEFALKVFDSHPGEAVAERGETLIELGDWRLTAGTTKTAMDAYREAWKVLSAAGSPGSAALDSPMPVVYRPPSSSRPPKSEPEKYTQRHAEVEFTVTADGRVRDAKLGANDAGDVAGKSVLSAIKRARYRPRFVDGNPVQATGVRYKETIYVRS
jgi:tetratricopeptide (TPR) repeat protein